MNSKQFTMAAACLALYICTPANASTDRYNSPPEFEVTTGLSASYYQWLDARMQQISSFMGPSLAAVVTAPAASDAIDPITTRSIRSAVFGSVALPFANLPAAARWRHVYSQMSQELEADCRGNRDCLDRGRQMRKTIDAASKERFSDRLRLVNSEVNGLINYASDREIYGQVDYWATPAEIISMGRGDCEDYAILKMAALKAAGVPASSMSLVVLRDHKRNLFHAVLAVATDQGHFILDNTQDGVLLDRSIVGYQPLFSMSQDRYWIHGVRRAIGEVASRPFSIANAMPGEGPDSLK